jgi:hypothetical protein
MKLIELKTTICQVIIIVFGIMSFLTKDILNSELFASIVVIASALLFQCMSTQNTNINEKE